MGQQIIADLLNDHYPAYMAYQDIMKELSLSKGSVLRCLKALGKRNEVEYKIIIGEKKKAGWKKLYRSKRGI